MTIHSIKLALATAAACAVAALIYCLIIFVQISTLPDDHMMNAMFDSGLVSYMFTTSLTIIAVISLTVYLTAVFYNMFTGQKTVKTATMHQQADNAAD